MASGIASSTSSLRRAMCAAVASLGFHGGGVGGVRFGLRQSWSTRPSARLGISLGARPSTSPSSVPCHARVTHASHPTDSGARSPPRRSPPLSFSDVGFARRLQLRRTCCSRSPSPPRLCRCRRNARRTCCAGRTIGFSRAGGSQACLIRRFDSFCNPIEAASTTPPTRKSPALAAPTSRRSRGIGLAQRRPGVLRAERRSGAAPRDTASPGA